MTKAAFAGLLIGLTMACAAAAHAEPSLCGAGETSLFACPIGHKLVSVCSSGAKAVYRFGLPGKVEMSSDMLFMADRGFSGGGETQITFRNKVYSYTVYDKTTRTSFSSDGHNNPDTSSGLVVQKNGKTISAAECGSDAAISAMASHIIQQGPFVEH